MYETKHAVAYVLLAASVSVGYSYRQRIFPLDDYDGDGDGYRDLIPRYNHDVPASSCDTENANRLVEIKSEIQNLQQLVVGLRQKLDPDFKLPTSLLRGGLFTTSAVDNMDHNPTAPIATASFHGTGISAFQHPTKADKAESMCPPGFHYVARVRSCYKVVYEEHSWTEADWRCRNFHPGARLAVITNNEENLGLIAYLQPELTRNSNRVAYTIGYSSQYIVLWTSGQRLNETSCTDEFVWKIGTSRQLPLSFIYWGQNEPNCHDSQPEGCLQLKNFVGLKWNDAPCSSLAFPLCEYDPLFRFAPGGSRHSR